VRESVGDSEGGEVSYARARQFFRL
jgi:hypothetical protein